LRNAKITQRLANPGPNKTARESALIHRPFYSAEWRETAPDASWIQKSPRASVLSLQERSTFAPNLSELRGRLRSPSDTLADLQEKNGGLYSECARLGWLLDPVEKRVVHIYRPRQGPECLETPNTSPAKTSFPDSSSNFRKYSSGSPQFASLSPQQHNEERAAG